MLGPACGFTGNRCNFFEWLIIRRFHWQNCYLQYCAAINRQFKICAVGSKSACWRSFAAANSRDPSSVDFKAGEGQILNLEDIGVFPH